ncbi:helix-turn-helix domain-containing protein [Candidatus Pristimantibacillus sp. PTI5]|uniref:helix-turn-helix domain-containing protein n=1 Tax=Candidatus Pristimantibacillus sp. PTI5 TaxID=3400422 RepID=UPI003B025ED1
MARKGQKFEKYSFELKKKAIELRHGGMTKQRVAEELGIADIGRLKVWMRKYKEQGDYGLMEHRGRRVQYKDQESYLKRLEMENAVLKKWLEITKKEVYQRSIGSSANFVKVLVSKNSVKKSVSPEVDSTHT